MFLAFIFLELAADLCITLLRLLASNSVLGGLGGFLKMPVPYILLDKGRRGSGLLFRPCHAPDHCSELGEMLSHLGQFYLLLAGQYGVMCYAGSYVE